MRSVAVTLIASAIRMASAWDFQQISPAGNDGEPSVAEMVTHLEARNQLTWEDLGNGDGASIAVYDDFDWDNARTHLKRRATPPEPRVTLSPRMPQAEGPVDTTITGTIGPVFPETVTVTTTVSSGTTAISAQNTHVPSKWVCKQPYNVPFSFASTAVTGGFCHYAWPLFEDLVTGDFDSVTRRVYSIRGQTPDNPPRPVRAVMVAEKKSIMPFMKALFCATLIQQIASNSYCWGYGEQAQLDPEDRVGLVKAEQDSTVGGTLYFYDESGTTVIGMVEIATMLIDEDDGHDELREDSY